MDQGWIKDATGAKASDWDELMEQRNALFLALSKALAVGLPEGNATSRRLWREAQEVWEKVSTE